MTVIVIVIATFVNLITCILIFITIGIIPVMMITATVIAMTNYYCYYYFLVPVTATIIHIFRLAILRPWTRRFHMRVGKRAP